MSTLRQQDFDKIIDSISHWGRWGTNDQLGALNLITPQKRKSAALLVDTGISLSLSHDVVKEVAASSPAFEHRMVSTGLEAGADLPPTSTPCNITGTRKPTWMRFATCSTRARCTMASRNAKSTRRERENFRFSS